jgi:hypothetical protein
MEKPLCKRAPILFPPSLLIIAINNNQTIDAQKKPSKNGVSAPFIRSPWEATRLPPTMANQRMTDGEERASPKPDMASWYHCLAAGFELFVC